MIFSKFKSSFGSESGSITSSYGSGSCKKFRILADPDPQHCLYRYLVLPQKHRIAVFGYESVIKIIQTFCVAPNKKKNSKSDSNPAMTFVQQQNRDTGPAFQQHLERCIFAVSKSLTGLGPMSSLLTTVSLGNK
jgi:hypothetical protein